MTKNLELYKFTTVISRIGTLGEISLGVLQEIKNMFNFNVVYITKNKADALKSSKFLSRLDKTSLQSRQVGCSDRGFMIKKIVYIRGRFGIYVYQKKESATITVLGPICRAGR